MKVLSVINRTEEELALCFKLHARKVQSATELKSAVISPAALCTIEVSKFPSCLTLAATLREDNPEAQEKGNESQLNRFSSRISLSLTTTWHAVKVEEGSPWRIYRRRVSRKHHLLLVLPRRDVAAFLKEMPDSLPLSSLVLPGTHDTMALYGWPISQCQSLATPLAVQLRSGIRVLDIRLASVKGQLVAFHGLYPERATFQSILSTIHDFLTAESTCHETIVMSVKQEDFATLDWSTFSSQVHNEIFEGPGGRDMWFLENRIPLLGEVRGKVILFSRFGGDGTGWEGGLEGLGIHPSTWPDSAKYGFTWECKGTTVRTQDWYNIPSFLSIPEKTSRATEVLLPSTDNSSNPNLAITFLSAASFPLAFPPTVARGFGWPRIGFGVEGVNLRVAEWLLSKLGGDGNTPEPGRSERSAGPRIRGWVMMDFFQDPQDNSVVPLLIECNFLGRVTGEEGWP